MMRKILLAILLSVVLVDAYKVIRPEKRQKLRLQPIWAYDDEFYPDYDYSAKESDGVRKPRPWTMSYWGNLLRKTRLPSWNITNPFSKLFTPYVVKVDFPPGTDPNQQPSGNGNKKKKTQQDYIYVNAVPHETEEETPHYFYDPVTQQYYEVVDGTAQDYDPENNYYATTFKDDDEVVINLNDEGKDQISNQSGEIVYTTSSEEVNHAEANESEKFYLAPYNEPTVTKTRAKRLRKEERSKTRNRNQRRPSNWFNQQSI